jgi:cell wall-associated NlpC family hydrolase
LSWIPTRPQAVAALTLTAALVLTALPSDAVMAAPPSAPGPALAAVTFAPGRGSQGTRAAAAEASHGPTLPAATQARPATVPASSIVLAFARSHLRAHYRASATGPASFDCSGLIWRVFKEAGLGGKVTSQSARSIYLSYRARGLASRHDPRIGDLVVWGNGSHIGVYIGNGRAISALIRGVRVHRVRAMLTPFTAYLHTHLSTLARPAWKLQVATHMRTLRHTTRSVFLRDQPSRSGASVGSLQTGTRFVVLARRKDGAGRLWLRAMTLGGRTGWVPALASTR